MNVCVRWHDNWLLLQNGSALERHVTEAVHDHAVDQIDGLQK
jgi:hypothetical protein